MGAAAAGGVDTPCDSGGLSGRGGGRGTVKGKLGFTVLSSANVFCGGSRSANSNKDNTLAVKPSVGRE